MENVESKIEPQQYIVSWTWVVDNTNEAVVYEVDTDNDWTFDESINLPPIYQDNIAPTTSYNISWELNANTTNSYIETVTIDLNAIDNDWWTWVDKIYYAIWTDTWSLVYVEYTESLIVNWVWNYTLNYYSKDLFGNIEEGTSAKSIKKLSKRDFQWKSLFLLQKYEIFRFFCLKSRIFPKFRHNSPIRRLCIPPC